MQIKNKKIIFIILILIILLILIGLLIKNNNKSNNNIPNDLDKYDYYYNYIDDNNKLSKSLKLYNIKGEIQSNYYVFDGDKIVGYTKATSCVITESTYDLTKNEDVTFAFSNDINTKYKAVYKK